MKYEFKTKPWPHQVKAFKFVVSHLKQHGSAGLQVPMRYGKTKIAIDAASAMHMLYGIKHVLIVTTTSGLGVWEKEIPKHCPVPFAVRNYEGLGIAASADRIHDPRLHFMVTHHALLYDREQWQETEKDDEGNDKVIARGWNPMPSKLIERYAPEMVIIDESHKIGDFKSEQSKMAYRYGQGARFRMNLTGTKFHRGPRFVFGQFRFLDESIFGSVLGVFNSKYIKYGGYGGYEIVGYRNLDDMSERIKSRVFIADKLPPNRPPVITTIPVEMEECKPYYKEMVSDAGIVVNGKAILAPIILTKHLRCQMIAGGWAKDEDGRYHRVGEEKYRALLDLLGLYMDEEIQKIVIGARFVPELRDIARAAKNAGYRRIALHGGIPRGDPRTARVEGFRVAKEPTVMVCQIAAAAEAVDMSEASNMIFYSMPDSYVQYDQFKSRIEKYNDPRTLTYDHLLMRHSRDEVSYEAMTLKMDVATYLVSDPARVERISEREDAFFRPV